MVTSPHYYLHAYKYFYYNPVKAGICARVEDYKYSTLRGLLGLDHLLVPVTEDTTLFSDVEGTLRWLNQRPDDNHWDAVKKALKKQQFKLRSLQSTNREHPLETARL